MQPVTAPASGLRVAKWVFGGMGLLSLIAGATLWSLDGRQGCALLPGQEECPRVLATAPAGIALATVGGAALVTSGVMFGVEYRQREHLVLTLAGRFP